MTVNVLMLLILGAVGLVLVLISVPFFLADQKMLKNCTQIVKGRVIRYTAWENSGVSFPVVEYYVDQKRYRQALKYSAVIRISSPFHSVNTTVENDVTGNKLVIRSNSGVYTDPIVTCFPVGSELDVYYDPQKPKRSYVMRPIKNPAGLILLLTGLGFIALGVLLLFIGPKAVI